MIEIPVCCNCGTILVYVNPKNELLKYCQICKKQCGAWFTKTIKTSHDLNKFFERIYQERKEKEFFDLEFLIDKITEYVNDKKELAKNAESKQ